MISELLLLSATVSLHLGSTYWFEPHRPQPAPIRLDVSSNPGTYHTWAWVAADTRVEVTIDGTAVVFAAPPGESGRTHVWVRGPEFTVEGQADVDDKHLEVVYPDTVASVVLSTNPAFDPREYHICRKVFDDPRVVEDARWTPTRHTNAVFEPIDYPTRGAWERDRAKLRQTIALANGLWPPPARTPLNAMASRRHHGDGYRIEAVRFEAFPGIFVTGNLYVPEGDGPFPAILNPHGHWENGRLEMSEKANVPARCATFARMGIVAFAYDMIGYQDSLQLPHVFGTREQKLWAIHPMAIQLWFGVRSLDYLETLPYVDRDRIGITGASGGGTQTFMLAAVDDRIKASAPVNMVSHVMQGGCVCENAPLIRMRHSNVEIAALTAPRPMLLVSCTGDWTRNTPEVEYPAIRRIYDLYGAGEQVSNVHIDAGHNYNAESRQAVYRFFAEHLLGRAAFAIPDEASLDLPHAEALRVFPDGLPDAVSSHNRRLLERVKGIRQHAFRQVVHACSVDSGRSVVGTGPENYSDAYANLDRDCLATQLNGVFNALTGVSVPGADAIDANRIDAHAFPDRVVERWIIGRKGVGDRIPAIVQWPSVDAGTHGASGAPVFLVAVRGKGNAGFAVKPPAPEKRLGHVQLPLEQPILEVDVFGVGEHGKPQAVAPDASANGFVDTFAPSSFAQRVQDVVTAKVWFDSVTGERSVLRALDSWSGRDNSLSTASGLLAVLAAHAIYTAQPFDVTHIDPTRARGPKDLAEPAVVQFSRMGSRAEFVSTYNDDLYMPSFVGLGGMQTVWAAAIPHWYQVRGGLYVEPLLSSDGSVLWGPSGPRYKRETLAHPGADITGSAQFDAAWQGFGSSSTEYIN